MFVCGKVCILLIFKTFTATLSPLSVSAQIQASTLYLLYDNQVVGHHLLPSMNVEAHKATNLVTSGSFYIQSEKLLDRLFAELVHQKTMNWHIQATVSATGRMLFCKRNSDGSGKLISVYGIPFHNLEFDKSVHMKGEMA